MPPVTYQGTRPTGQIIATGVGGAAAGLATGATIAATVPVVGWAVGGVLAGAAGVTALVQGIANRRVKKAEAVAWARRLGLPDPDEVPGFVVRLRRLDPAKRRKLLERYQRRVARYRSQLARWRSRPGARRTLQVATLGILRGPERLRAAIARNEAKIGLILALEDRRQAPRAGARSGGELVAVPRLPGQAVPPSAPDAPGAGGDDIAPASGFMDALEDVPWGLVLGGVVLLGGLWYLSKQGGKGGGKGRGEAG